MLEERQLDIISPLYLHFPFFFLPVYKIKTKKIHNYKLPLVLYAYELDFSSNGEGYVWRKLQNTCWPQRKQAKRLHNYITICTPSFRFIWRFSHWQLCRRELDMRTGFMLENLNRKAVL
jgi:hypothetical protein